MSSGSTDFSVTRDDIIKRALRLIGVLAQGETPSAAQIADGAFALNSLVKAWQADGMPLWALKSYNVPLVAGTKDYEIGLGKAVNIPKPLKVQQAYNHSNTSNIDIPMRLLTKQEYNMLGNKTSAGNPIQCYYNPQLDYGILSVFPVPATADATNNVVTIYYQRPFDDFDISTDTPDFPQEWFDAVMYGLATRLAPEYGVAMTDRKLLWQEMTIIKQDALNFGLEEGSLYFGVDRRSW
jgi:hypothetical protein